MSMYWMRTDREEILDREGTSSRGQRILDDVDRWNRLVGWYRFHVRRVAEHWEALGKPRPLRVLDIGTGPAGLLDAISTHFDGEGIPVELVGVDLHPAYVDMARERMGERAEIVEADATDLPYDDQTFDIATTTLMMHHLPYHVRERMVAEIGRVCRSAYIFDVRLRLFGYLGCGAASTVLRMGSDARHDGMLSMRRACTYKEFQELVGPLPVKAQIVVPSAMCTVPE